MSVTHGRWRASLWTFLLICACGPETLDVPPASISGLWTTTDDPRYVDRAFEITQDFLFLLQGGDTFAVHTIHEVQVQAEEGELPSYTIEYRGDESELYSFRVYLSQVDGGTLLFPNQMNMRWHRAPDTSVPWRVPPDSGRDAVPGSGP